MYLMFAWLKCMQKFTNMKKLRQISRRCWTAGPYSSQKTRHPSSLRPLSAISSKIRRQGDHPLLKRSKNRRNVLCPEEITQCFGESGWKTGSAECSTCGEQQPPWVSPQTEREHARVPAVLWEGSEAHWGDEPWVLNAAHPCEDNVLITEIPSLLTDCFPQNCNLAGIQEPKCIGSCHLLPTFIVLSRRNFCPHYTCSLNGQDWFLLFWTLRALSQTLFFMSVLWERKSSSSACQCPGQRSLLQLGSILGLQNLFL